MDFELAYDIHNPTPVNIGFDRTPVFLYNWQS